MSAKNNSQENRVLRSEEIIETSLDEKQRQTLQKELENRIYPTSDDIEGREQFIKETASIVDQIIPTYLKLLLGDLNNPNGPVAVFVHNLPTGVVPRPPADGYRPVNKSSISEAILLGMVKNFGEPFAYKQEKFGELIHEIIPLAGKENTNSNAGRKDFPWHTDNAGLPKECRPDYLALSGLINDAKAKTLVLSVEDVVAALSAKDIELLSQPLFCLSMPESFDFGGGQVFTEKRPILMLNSAGKFEIAVSSYNAKADSSKAAEAVLGNLLNQLHASEGQSFMIGPGDLLIFNNSRVLHGRTPFLGDRWLQRVYVRKDLSVLRALTNTQAPNRVFDARFLVLK